MTTDVVATSEDAVLGGQLRLRQPLKGHRVGHDAILLAVATGGRSGDTCGARDAAYQKIFIDLCATLQNSRR